MICHNDIMISQLCGSGILGLHIPALVSSKKPENLLLELQNLRNNNSFLGSMIHKTKTVKSNQPSLVTQAHGAVIFQKRVVLQRKVWLKCNCGWSEYVPDLSESLYAFFSLWFLKDIFSILLKFRWLTFKDDTADSSLICLSTNLWKDVSSSLTIVVYVS